MTDAKFIMVMSSPKVSIPMLHSAVAILKLSQMSFSGANALFLRTLLLKKCAHRRAPIAAAHLINHIPTFFQALLSSRAGLLLQVCAAVPSD